MKPVNLRWVLAAAVASLATGVVAAPAMAASGSSDRCGDANCTMEQTIQLDAPREEITLPFYTGVSPQGVTDYVVTESSSKEDAERRGVNYAAKLTNARGTRAVQRVTVDANGAIVFPGGVDFNPAPTDPLRPGPDGMPSGIFPPGARGDANYSPLVELPNGIILNASHVRNSTGFHDSYVRQGAVPAGFRPSDRPGAPRPAGEITMSLFLGFSNTHPELYLHMDASSPEVATFEGSTFADNLDFAPGQSSNDSAFSARSAIIAIENGEEARGNPGRQGLNSFVQQQGDPLNITQTFPGRQDERYSPVWDIHQVRWTEAAIAAGERRRLESPSDLIKEFRDGNIVSTGTGPPNPSLGGIRSNGAISNCPVVAQIPGVDPGERGEPGTR